MNLSNFMDLYFLGIPVMAFVIFFARIVDVSMGTMRIVFISRGYRLAATSIGFFEVMIWIMAVGQVIKNINTPILILAYAGGYATGSYVGMFIESKIRLGKVILRIITKKPATKVVDELREQNFGVTRVAAEGTEGKVHLLFMVLRRSDLDRAITIVKKYHPKAFLSVEDVRQVIEGNFPKTRVEKFGKLVHRK
jgi:uncharacterized protein YebE (UPF0316 family)